MDSKRFGRPIAITQHAALRMAERAISEETLLDLVETGEVREKDATHVWIAKRYPQRADNLLCAAAVLEAAVVVKTVMHHFSWSTSDENDVLPSG